MPGAGGRTRPLLGTRARRRLFEPAPPPPRGSAPSRSLSSLSKQGRGPRAHVVSEEVVPLGPWRREQPPDVAWCRADGGRPHSAQTDKGPPPPSATAPADIRLHVLGASRGFHVTRDAPAGQLPTVMGGQGAAEGLKRKLLPLRSPPPVPASAWEGAPPPHTPTGPGFVAGVVGGTGRRPSLRREAETQLPSPCSPSRAASSSTFITGFVKATCSCLFISPPLSS